MCVTVFCLAACTIATFCHFNYYVSSVDQLGWIVMGIFCASWMWVSVSFPRSGSFQLLLLQVNVLHLVALLFFWDPCNATVIPLVGVTEFPKSFPSFCIIFFLSSHLLSLLSSTLSSRSLTCSSNLLFISSKCIFNFMYRVLLLIGSFLCVKAFTDLLHSFLKSGEYLHDHELRSEAYESPSRLGLLLQLCPVLSAATCPLSP